MSESPLHHGWCQVARCVGSALIPALLWGTQLAEGVAKRIAATLDLAPKPYRLFLGESGYVSLRWIPLPLTSRKRSARLEREPGLANFVERARWGYERPTFLIGLSDHRLMAIECKVSNSSTNSIKRLNNDAAAKAEDWIKQFGPKMSCQ